MAGNRAVPLAVLLGGDQRRETPSAEAAIAMNEKTCLRCGAKFMGTSNRKVCINCSASIERRREDSRKSTYRAVWRARMDGLIPPLTGRLCVDCGAPATRYDHRDYGKPLDVEPVCHGCNIRRGPAIDASSKASESRKNSCDTGVIREYMKATGQNQSTFARRVGVHRSTVTLWVQGRRRPSKDQAWRIHTQTGIALEKLREP